MADRLEPRRLRNDWWLAPAIAVAAMVIICAAVFS
jgi:hypothetical protein